MGFFFGKAKAEKSREERIADFVAFLQSNGVTLREKPALRGILMFSQEYDHFVLKIGRYDTTTLVFGYDPARGKREETPTELFTHPERFAERFVHYELPHMSIYEIDIATIDSPKRRETVLRLLSHLKIEYSQLCERPEYKKYLETSTLVEPTLLAGVRPETNSGMRIYRLYARECIYKLHPEKYPLPFEEYEVHHINGDPMDNDLRNLAIVTKEQHQKIHARTW